MFQSKVRSVVSILTSPFSKGVYSTPSRITCSNLEFRRGAGVIRQKKGIEIKLLEDVKNLGKKDSVVIVKPGHMRDDLFPKRLAEYVVKRRVHRNRAAEEAAKESK